MKLFIFGAGASRGSSFKSTEAHWRQSPLSNELLDVTYKDYAKELSLDISYLRQLYIERTNQVQSLEEWLTELWEQANHGGGELTDEAATSLRGDLGRFAHYLRWMFQSFSKEASNLQLYDLLLKKLRTETHKGGRHTFINFNYDTLFDIAFAEVWSRNIDTVDSYISQKILKPHGSINWFGQKRVSDVGIAGRNSDGDWMNRYRVAAANTFNGSPISLTNYKFFDPRHNDLKSPSIIYSQEFNWNYFQPLIYLPLSEKMISHIPELSSKIESGASVLLPPVAEVYLIGYKANDNLIHDWVEKYFGSKVVLNVVSNSKETSDSIMRIMLDKHPSKIVEGKSIYDPSGSNGFKHFVDNYDKNIF